MLDVLAVDVVIEGTLLDEQFDFEQASEKVVR